MSGRHPIFLGTVTHLFVHRFVIQTADGTMLADLTPEGVEQIALTLGDEVSLEGEMKRSELKVTRLTRAGQTIDIQHAKRHHDKDHLPADPAIALQSARAAGFEPIGEPRRKPKHFEVVARRGGAFFELHIELDGRLRKTKPRSGHSEASLAI